MNDDQATLEQLAPEQHLEDVAKYLRIGREFGSLHLIELTARYRLAVALAVALTRREAVRLMCNLRAEFTLRGLQPPLDVFDAHEERLAELREKNKSKALEEIEEFKRRETRANCAVQGPDYNQ